MNNSYITEIDNALKDFPGNLAKLIKISMDSKNSGKKLPQDYPDPEIIKSEFEVKN